MANNYPYAYPYHPHAYPPPPNTNYPHPPPPNSFPYTPPYPYPQPMYPPVAAYPVPVECHTLSPPHSKTAPYAYPYMVSPYPAPAPPRTLQHQHSFSNGLAPTSHDAPAPPSNSGFERPSGEDSLSSHHRHDSASPIGTSLYVVGEGNMPHAYRPHDSVTNVNFSDYYPSAPASPPAPSVPALPGSPETPVHHHQSQSWAYGDKGNFYGCPNDSSNWERSYFGRINSFQSSPTASFSHSDSFTRLSTTRDFQIVPFNKGSLKVILLHGNLDIWVYEARNLPNLDFFHKTLGDVFGRLPGNVKNTSDPYVSISIGGAVVGRTFVIRNNESPVWMQHFHVHVAHFAAEVHFLVKDSDVVGSQLIGVVSIPVEQIHSGAKFEGTFEILNSSGKPCKPGAVLRLSIQYTEMENLHFYDHGVGAGPDYYGVPGTYFPIRKGGKVTLYQDAHVPDGLLPTLKLDIGMGYLHGKCWQDIFRAISQARRLIYIAGWSIWHQVRMVRDSGLPSDFSLGEILRTKSREGVRVLLLVWDDPTSRSILGYKTDGLMQTHDEETRRFFKNSSVQVLLCPRIAGKRHSWVKQKEVGTIYTHHQKTVIVDADAGNNYRKIIAFLGGLDLCDGRYDTPQHPLFRTLQTVHKDDYHNPTFTGNVVGCPREAWHDLHCRIDGPAAYDVLTNFEERWLKASKPHGIKKLRSSYDDALLRIERIPDIIGIHDFPFSDDDSPENWHVQVFRSIDSNSVKGFPKDPKDATSKNLVCGKNVLIDMSIHTAYVKAIRSAQHFIYIENQYFIGSSFNWSSHKDLGADNLIPMEIALKIASKIKANERFSVYVLVPMWPEGVPTGAATQRILFWQHKTMQMMYETIYKALLEAGLEEAFSPQDYLNFFCLGNREIVDGLEASVDSNSADTPRSSTRKSRRFMIYVHSKGMIVDDEYVIIGSANINQRSMEGTRDTEIAMGAYQPYHTWARKLSYPRGQIYGYRMSLWAEHTGVVEDCFSQPETVECVRRIRMMSEINWEQFVADDITEMRGHLMKYPVEVDRKGKVRPLPCHGSFPDVGGNICGSFLAIQENLTI